MWQVFPAQYYELAPSLSIGQFSFAELAKWNLPDDKTVVQSYKTQISRVDECSKKPKLSYEPTKDEYVYFVALAAYFIDKNRLVKQARRFLTSVLSYKEIFELFQNGFMFGSFVSLIYQKSIILNDSQQPTCIQNNWKRALLVLKEDVRISTELLFSNAYSGTISELMQMIQGLLIEIFRVFKVDLTVAFGFAERLFKQQGSGSQMSDTQVNALVSEGFESSLVEQRLFQLGLPFLDDAGWRTLINFAPLMKQLGFRQFELPHYQGNSLAQRIQNAAVLAAFLGEKHFAVVRDCKDLLNLDAASLNQLLASIFQNQQRCGLSCAQSQLQAQELSKNDAEVYCEIRNVCNTLRICQSYQNEISSSAILDMLQNGMIYLEVGILHELLQTTAVALYRQANQRVQSENRQMPCAKLLTLSNAFITSEKRFAAADATLQLQQKCRKIGLKLADLTSASAQQHWRILQLCVRLPGLKIGISEPADGAEVIYLVGTKVRCTGLVNVKYQAMELCDSGLDLDLLDS